MSRAYRIQVQESLKRVVRAEDHVSTQLEVLDILPCDQMADLLARELEKDGYEREDNIATKSIDGTIVTIDLKAGLVEVRREASKQEEVTGEKAGSAYDDVGPSSEQVRAKLNEELKKDLEKKVDHRQGELQKAVTDALEAELGDIRKGLDKAVNRATAEALKQKAASLGQIKELTEDPESGSMTIVIEV